MISSAVTRETTPARRAITTAPESTATLSSSPVPTSGVCGIEERYALPLHVGAHERTVRVIVLQERNQRRRDRDELLGRDVHVVDAAGRRERRVALMAAQHQLIDKRPVRVERGIGLRDRRVFLAVGIEPRDLRRDAPVLDDAVRRLDEPEVVHPRIAGERRDESNVRTFRRLDRAHPTVLRVVHVADLESRALTREPARTERRQPPLVRQLRQRDWSGP